jgi:putative acetyltransferase
MNAEVTLRPYRESDLAAVTRLYRETVQRITREQYSQAQVDAWAPENPDLERWRAKLAAEEVVVAELAGEVVGFCSWDATGYVDFLYVHPAHQRQGIALKLYSAAESALKAKALGRVHAQVSLTAQPFFSKQGFEIVKQQHVNVSGVSLPNAVMEKRIADPD